MEAFEEFWIAYPPRQGVRTGKATARTAWQRHVRAVDVEPIMATVERLKQSKQWQKDDGQFVPLAATFLNQRRWEDDAGTASVKRGKDYSSWEKQA